MGIHYQYLIIILMVVFTSLAVVDRFTTNLFPMYLNHPESPIFPDDWTATTFVVIAWIAGRELIVSSAFIYLLQCKCIANWLFEHKPSWLIIDDIHIENKRLHYHIGWLAVALPIIIHSYLVFLPLTKYPTNKLVLHQQWMRPIDHETGFYVHNYKDHTINIAINDLYALFVVSICFMLLFPLSSNKTIRQKYYTLANYTHLLAAALYAIELLRTPFTIHCWFFCGPIIVLYIMDRIYGIYWYRASNETKLICKYNIDNDYVALFLHIPNIPTPKPNTYLGDIYWLNCQRYVENKAFAHPFTTFYNHCNNDIQSFLFSSLMRSFPSHRGHRFPIRPTAEKHQHVLYHQVDQAQPPQAALGDFELMRTDTAASATSVSGLAIPKLHKLQTSPSESVKLHALNIEKPQQIKLFKVSENGEPPRTPKAHMHSTYFVRSPSSRVYMTMAKDMKPCFTATVSEDDEEETEEEKEDRDRYHKSGQTVIGDGSCSGFSLPALSYRHSEDDEPSDADGDSEDKYVPIPPSEECSSTATFKGGPGLNVSKPKTFTNRTDADSVINENMEVSYSHMHYMQKAKKVQFGTLEVPKQIELTDDNLWIDEKVEEEFEWNVALIMKVRHSRDSFTAYVADELGYNYADTDKHDEMESDPSFTNTFTDCNGYTATHIYSYGPYRSAFGHIIEECFVNKNAIVLIATGAGVSYILDFLLYSRAQNIEGFAARVDIHFSCGSIKLFQWITDLICAPTVKKQHNLYVNAHLTSHENINGYNDEQLDEHNTGANAAVGRMSFESVLRSSIVNTKVFFCGSPFMETKLIKLCNELRFKMYKAHCF